MAWTFPRLRRKSVPDDWLRGTPGPSPWYLRGTSITTSRGALTWQDAGNGKVKLCDRWGRAYVILNFYCYFQPVAGERALLWYLQPSAADPRVFDSVQLRLLNLDALSPIGHDNSRDQAFFQAGDAASVSIPSTLPAGRHAFQFPSNFAEFSELLILVRCTSHDAAYSYAVSDLALWSVRPNENLIDVYPQDWFNNGSYDFGYQWVTRVSRDQQSGKILGDGIRIRKFVLDPTLRGVESRR